jgi:hypothetical protein
MCDILPPAINDTTLSSDLSRVTASRTPKLRISPCGTSRIVIPGETAACYPCPCPTHQTVVFQTPPQFIATRPAHCPPFHTRKACISTSRPANSPIVEIFPKNTASHCTNHDQGPSWRVPQLMRRPRSAAQSHRSLYSFRAPAESLCH